MEIAIRASVMFLLMWGLTRGMRRRSFADMSPFEMILLVVLGDIVQQGITQEDYSVTGAVIVVATFATWISAWTWLSYRSDRARKFLEGVPLVIIVDGHLVDEAVRAEQVPLADILAAARQQGISRLSDIGLGVLEPSGKFSFIQHPDQ